MRSKQTGITFIGWIILLAPMAICAYAAIRITPIYLNWMKVAKSLEQVKTELKDGGNSNQQQVHRAIEDHFNIEGIEFPEVKDIKISRQGRSWQINAAYDDQAPLFANVFILVSFDKTVTVGSESGE
jgi:Domain of unknown function (DUF4845)